jgi:hypothetical protein
VDTEGVRILNASERLAMSDSESSESKSTASGRNSSVACSDIFLGAGASTNRITGP